MLHQTGLAEQIKQMLDERYMDNLNTYRITSLYETLESREARWLAERLDIHYTPKRV